MKRIALIDDRSLYLAGTVGAVTGLALTTWLTRDWDWEVPAAINVTFPTREREFGAVRGLLRIAISEVVPLNTGTCASTLG